MNHSIPFNKPFIIGNELKYIQQAVENGHISSDGNYTQACSKLLQQTFKTKKVLMTPSCTAALEMTALLIDIKPGDEIIVPSYTFVSTANAFVLFGAKPIFVDIRSDTLNIDESLLEQAITHKTKAIVPVHYAGVSCNMKVIKEIAKSRNLLVVEDAAQGVNSFYNGSALGTIGDFGTYSFHETKNFICGEGGALLINNEKFIERAEIIRNKGTNRQKFLLGEVDKYTWVDKGSSYLPSEINCAFLLAQLENLDKISQKRSELYNNYSQLLKELATKEKIQLPIIPDNCSGNAHLFYILTQTQSIRNDLINFLKKRGIAAPFHYIPLHDSPLGTKLGRVSGSLKNTEDLSTRLIRLPLYFDLKKSDQELVVNSIYDFYKS